MSSTGSTPISYKPQVNRAITKRWAEAKQISYEGNDWGDNDYEPTPSARGVQQPGWASQNASTPRSGALPSSQGLTQSNRSFTNPSPSRNIGRSSFDRGDDRRNISPNTPSSRSEGPYPTAQYNPLPDPQYDSHQPYQESSRSALHGQRPLHIQTPARPQARDLPPPVRPSPKDHAPYNRPPSTFDNRSGSYQDSTGGVTHGPGDAGRRSESSGRPSLSDLQGRSESPYRTVNPPISARSQHSPDESPARRFPPRKSSLSQVTQSLEPNLQSGLSDSAVKTIPTSDSTDGAKPLPFIRPADIYKRMEEEREKERRSQESSRQSIDSNASRPRERERGRDIFTSARQSRESSRPKIDTTAGMSRDHRSPAPAQPTSSQASDELPGEKKSVDAPGEMEAARKLKGTLDPVAERKSEYGFENMLKGAGPEQQPSSVAPVVSPPPEGQSPLSATSAHSGEAEPLTAVSASSKHSDKPDLVTTSSRASEKSLPQFLPVFRGVSGFGTDFIEKGLKPSDNSSPEQQSDFEAQNMQPSSSTTPGVPQSALEQGQEVGSTEAITSEPQVRHNPSVGLRSVVHQGFDDSQEQVPPTPLSSADSVGRSNSASASEISPIIGRTPTSAPAGANTLQRRVQHPSIAQEMGKVSTVPVEFEAAKATTLAGSAQKVSEPALPPTPPPPPVKDGYRRDYSLPKPGNSQARTSLTAGTGDVPEAEVASKSSATPTSSRIPWQTPHTPSEDSQDRGNQMKAFRPNAPFKDTPLPDLPTSGAISGPSTRGTVREIAERLESRSGRASPAVSLEQAPETLRPSHARLDSFRPSLPGGWQSYSTNTEASGQQPEQGAILRIPEQTVGPTDMQRDQADYSPVSSEDDDIPTAGPTKPRSEESGYDPSKTASAAAAASGNALVGAFTSARGSGTKNEDISNSYEVSEDESTAANSGAREVVSTRDLGNATSNDQADAQVLGREGKPTATSPLAPSPPTKDTPSDVDTPSSMLGYFPLPLKTNKVPEVSPPVTNHLSSPPHPPIVPVLGSETSTQDTESDRLRKEIVRSLTPKSTQYEGESAGPFDGDAPLPQVPVANQPHSSGVESSALAEPEESYARNLSSGPNQTRSSHSHTALALAISDKALPQPNASIDDRPQPDAAQARNATYPENRPALQHRFSWEPQPESETQNFGQSAALASASSPRATHGIGGESGTPGTIRPSVQPNTPSTTNSSHVVPPTAPTDTLRRVPDDAPTNLGKPRYEGHPALQSTSVEPTIRADNTGLRATDPNSFMHSSAREMPFRNILSLGTPQDRIQAFNSNRALVANQDTGLEEWLRAVGNQLSEHSEIVRNNGRLSAQENEDLASFKPSPARSKFQRLASLANATQSTDPEYDPSASNSPSSGKVSALHMPGQRKKLLKDAGKIGGQAGSVAKGLFAKGKNKLRTGGTSSDKGVLAGRRRSSQPIIVIDEPHHSSITTNTPPQIPNLNISPIEGGDQWYKSIDSASSPLHERSISPINIVARQESNNRELMLPGHVDRPVQQIRQSSPRVSAVGSFHEGDVPSRSISEVTQPTNSGDERSPIAPIPEGFSTSTVTESIAADGSRHPGPVTAVPTLGAGPSSTRVSSAPVSDALGPLPDLAKTANATTSRTAIKPDGAEPDLPADQDMGPRAQGQERGALAQASNALATLPFNSQSVHSAIHNEGSRLPLEQEAAMQISNLPPDSERTIRPTGEPYNVSGAVSEPPVGAATPPYTETQLSKGAEAALYRSQVDSSRDGLPAYDTNGEDRRNARQSRIGPGASIIPIADLSHRRNVSSGPAQSRPFSFVSGETLISPQGQVPDKNLSTSSAAPPIQPDLAKEISIAGFDGDRDSLDLTKGESKSYSRPLATDPNVGDHPAYRKSQDMARNKEIFLPQDKNENIQPTSNRSGKTVDDDGRYRIPGPYVQEYRSPKQQPQGLAVKQLPPTKAGMYERPAQRSALGMDPLRSHDPHSGNQVEPPGQPISNNVDPATKAVAPAISDRPRQPSKGGLFRTRSKSRSIRSRNEETQKAENKTEKRGGLFKSRTKGEDTSSPSQRRSLGGESGNGFNRQISRDSVDHNAAKDETADQVGDLDSTQTHMALKNSGSGNPLQNDTRKKRFSGLGSLFGRSGTGATKSSTKYEGPQTVQRASTLSHYILGKPDPGPQQNSVAPDSMYAQNQQRRQNLPQQGQVGSYQMSQPGPNVPIEGYYAPTQRKQAGMSNLPHGPDSFFHGRFSAEQKTNPSQHSTQYNQTTHLGQTQPGPQRLDQQLPSQVSQPEGTRPPLQINTDTTQVGVRHGLNHHFVTAPPGPAPQLPLPSQSSSETRGQVSYYGSQRPTSPYESRQGARSPYAYSGTRGTNPNTSSHVIDLHKRSRSPRNGRKLSDDERLEEINRNDPASQLGTFSKSPVPRSDGADSSQEAPWRIGLPNNEEEENKRKSHTTLQEREREQVAPDETTVVDKNANAAPAADPHEDETKNISPEKSEEKLRKQEQPQHERTVAEKVMGVQLPRVPLPLQRSTSAGNAIARASKMSPVELPGSKAPGDDSDEEIVMSSTAYPGQEWAPENWGYGGNWDD